MLQIKTKKKLTKEQKTVIESMAFDYLLEQGHTDVQTAFISDKQAEALRSLNDRLADVLCMNAGVSLALRMQQGGNQESRKASLEFSRYIDEKLKEAKIQVHTLV